MYTTAVSSGSIPIQFGSGSMRSSFRDDWFPVICNSFHRYDASYTRRSYYRMQHKSKLVYFKRSKICKLQHHTSELGSCKTTPPGAAGLRLRLLQSVKMIRTTEIIFAEVPAGADFKTMSHWIHFNFCICIRNGKTSTKDLFSISDFIFETKRLKVGNLRSKTQIHYHF